MAYWAQLNENNIVTQVLATDNNLPDEGYRWLIDTFGGRWLKTSYNTSGGKHMLGGTPLRKNFAGIGSYYDEQRDAFYIPKSPHKGWVFEEESCGWRPPIPMPKHDGFYPPYWDDKTETWVIPE